MKLSSISMVVFAFYMALACVAFVFLPNSILPVLGFDAVTDVWIRILGYVFGALSFCYVMAVRERAYNFYLWTVYTRLPIVLFFTALVLLDKAPPVLIAIGALDSAGGLCTWVALRREIKSGRTH